MGGWGGEAGTLPSSVRTYYIARRCSNTLSPLSLQTLRPHSLLAGI